jgi:DNA-directed RNA polymerase specialized sigma24 family protein
MFATAEEVEAAIRQLSKADWLRLLEAASIVTQGSPFSAPRELLTVAISTTWLAAAGQGGRRWRVAIPFKAHLIMTMRGTASDARRAARRRGGDVPLDGQGNGPADLSEWSSPSPEQEEMDRVDREQREALADDVIRHFDSDRQVLWIITGIEEKLPARLVQALAGMTQVEYESARRRFHRGMDRLFPHRRLQ